ncbi:reverse transcriptase domain-containing protein [Tanacetum coccineum]
MAYDWAPKRSRREYALFYALRKWVRWLHELPEIEFEMLYKDGQIAAETRFANLDIWKFLRSNPSILGEDFFKACIAEARFEIIAKEDKEHIVEKKIDVILPLPLQGEFASPEVKGSLDEVKGSLDADEDIGVDEVSSAIDGVFDISESLVVFLKWVSISRSRPLLLLVIKGRAHSTDLVILTRQAQLNPDRTEQTPEIVLTVEVVLTGRTRLTEIVLEAKTAPAASKNRMITPAPHMGRGPNMDIARATKTAPAMRKEGGKVNPRYPTYRRAAPAMEDTGSQGQKDTSPRMRMTWRCPGYVERWAMPTWCHMFNSTLIGAARVWFDELPPESIDGYKDLKAAFLAYFMQQKKYVKDPVKIHNIKQRDGETIGEFME